MPNESNTHYHVIAVQDYGGTQECWRGWDDQWTQEQAEQHARDMIEADGAYCDGAERMKQAEAKFGERWQRLISTNVRPGWEAIFIHPCTSPCAWNLNPWVERLLTARGTAASVEPWWTVPAPPSSPHEMSDEASGSLFFTETAANDVGPAMTQLKTELEQVIQRFADSGACWNTMTLSRTVSDVLQKLLADWEDEESNELPNQLIELLGQVAAKKGLSVPRTYLMAQALCQARGELAIDKVVARWCRETLTQ